MGDILRIAYERGRKDYPAILGIHECLPSTYRQPTNTLLEKFGYGNWEQCFWDADDDEYLNYTNDGSGNFSGHVVLVEKDDKQQTIVFLQRLSTSKQSTLRDQGLCFAELMHELGHVDDIVNGIHIKRDQHVDMSKAEEYAHWFALERLIEESDRADEWAEKLPQSSVKEWRATYRSMFRPMVEFYVTEILEGLAKVDCESIRESARRVLDSTRIEKYRKFFELSSAK